MSAEYAPGYAPYPTIERALLPTLAYIALLLLIFVGLDAFSPPPAATPAGGLPATPSGDALRQIAFLGTAGLVALAAFQRLGLSMLRALPLSMVLLLAWCLASALWTPESAVAFRRAGLQVVIVVSVLLSVETIGPKRTFDIWRILLGIVLAVNFLSIPLIESARHGAGEVDAALVGNWRGLYGPKNIAGAVCAMTAILFLFTRTGRRNWIGIAVAMAAIVFLVMTRSKSSMGFLAAALLAGWLYHVSWRDGLSRAILLVSTGIFALALGTLIVLDPDILTRSLADPTQFTGRAAIWAAELAYIRDHPLLGAGFGTFADSGGLSPLHGYIASNWVEAVSHGHNGYLQILVTIGGIGFVLAMTALVVQPLRRFWPLNPKSGNFEADAFKPMLFAIFTFMVLHNFMESDFLEGGGAWAALLLVSGALNAGARRA
jgi:O-antigen ligase